MYRSIWGKPLVIYDFAPAPLKSSFSFLTEKMERWDRGEGDCDGGKSRNVFAHWNEN
jgi:hypothetical protein